MGSVFDLPCGFLAKPLSTVCVLAAAAMAAGSASASILEQVAPIPTLYTEGTDYDVMDYSGLGDVTAQVWGVDITLGLGNASTSGCEVADFAGFSAGSIALIQRGTCSFQLKAEIAAASGAVGVLIFNQGNTADRMDLLLGSLSSAYVGGIPVMGLSYTLGVELLALRGVVVRMQATRADLAPPITVPEPGSLALIGIAAVGLVAARRRGAKGESKRPGSN